MTPRVRLAAVIVMLAGASAIVAIVALRVSMPVPMPPRDLLRSAIIHHALAPGMSIDGAMSIVDPARGFSGSIVGSGWIRGGGSSWYIHGQLHVVRSGHSGVRRMTGPVEFFSPFPGTYLFRAGAVQGLLGDIVRSAQGDTSSWLVLKGSPPDDHHLMQDPALRLSEDNIDEILLSLSTVDATRSPPTMDDRRTLRLSLRIASGALIPLVTSAEGEVFLDVMQQTLSRVMWNIAFDSHGSMLLDLSFHPLAPDAHPPETAMWTIAPPDVLFGLGFSE